MSSKTILVIDDDVVYRELLTLGLQVEGYDVIAAENGMVAKEQLSRHDVDGIIVDLLMPMMDGLRFLHWLRQEKGDKDVPALVLTSVDEKPLAVEAQVAGAQDVLVKPVSLPALVSSVDELVGRPEAVE